MTRGLMVWIYKCSKAEFQRASYTILPASSCCDVHVTTLRRWPEFKVGCTICVCTKRWRWYDVCRWRLYGRDASDVKGTVLQGARKCACVRYAMPMLRIRQGFVCYRCCLVSCLCQFVLPSSESDHGHRLQIDAAPLKDLVANYLWRYPAVAACMLRNELRQHLHTRAL